MTAPDETLTAIGTAIELGRDDRTAGREALAGIWDRIGADGDPLHRCVLAHHLADLQDDPREELRWDLLALAAADSVTADRAERAGAAGPVAAFYPSLHLNLGEVYRRLGEPDRAREHLAAGRAAAGTLAADDYGKMIIGGLDRLARRIAVDRADNNR